MGTIFRKAWTMPLPDGAQLVEGKDGLTARWRIRGGKLRTAEAFRAPDGRMRVRGMTATYIAKYRDADGVWIEVPTGCRDETAARAVLSKLERRSELVRAGVVTAEEDAVSKHSEGPIATHVEAWARHLRLKGTSPEWIQQAVKRIERVVADESLRRLRDITVAPIERWLDSGEARGLSAATRNNYRTSLVAFLNWCVKTGRVGQNPLKHVAAADAKADRRRERRALTEEELLRLLDAARRRPLLEALTVRHGPRAGEPVARISAEARSELEALGRERALIYKTLVLTGLRKGELESITVGQLESGPNGTWILLKARDEKSRRGAEIPVREDLAKELREWIAERLCRRQADASTRGEPIPASLAPSEPLLAVSGSLNRVFDMDLVLAGLAKVEVRDGKQVIVKTDDRGRTIDIHALRHTFGTHLSKAGVPLRTAQAAMRHSDPSLTANVYTDPRMLDVAGALASLPRLVRPISDRVAVDDGRASPVV
jgi:integrase